MKIRVKWENYKSRRGVSILGWLREEKVKTYSDIVNKCHSLGVEPPSEEEVRVSLDLRSKEKAVIRYLDPDLREREIADEHYERVIKTTPAAPSPKTKSKPAPKKKAQPKARAKKPAAKKAQDK